MNYAGGSSLSRGDTSRIIVQIRVHLILGSTKCCINRCVMLVLIGLNVRFWEKKERGIVHMKFMVSASFRAQDQEEMFALLPLGRAHIQVLARARNDRGTLPQC
jgi:hypothetical protein